MAENNSGAKRGDVLLPQYLITVCQLPGISVHGIIADLICSTINIRSRTEAGQVGVESAVFPRRWGNYLFVSLNCHTFLITFLQNVSTPCL